MPVLLQLQPIDVIACPGGFGASAPLSQDGWHAIPAMFSVFSEKLSASADSQRREA